MCASVLSVATKFPQYEVDQHYLAEALAHRLQLSPLLSRKTKKIFNRTRIQKRYSVIPDYGAASLQGVLYEELFPAKLPGSLKRNRIYKQEAPKLAHQAAVKALELWGGRADAITHVISVSCTGIMAPGIEFLLMDSLGLNRTVSRLGINFMGCFGAFQGLDTAAAFAKMDPKNRVLLVCTELCSLHMQPSTQLSQLISNALFADGSAAVVIGSDPISQETASWEIVRKGSLALENTREEMTLEMGDDGCLMELTERVPKEIENVIESFANRLLQGEAPLEDCELLVHPGGRAILESVQRAFDLQDRLDTSWSVMEDYGNMSSATFLFVLERALKNKKYAVGIGFGPGLSIEGIFLKNAIPQR